jgi:hypothetical protein
MICYGILQSYSYEGNDYLAFFRKKENAEKHFKYHDLDKDYNDIVEIHFNDEEEDKDE